VGEGQGEWLVGAELAHRALRTGPGAYAADGGVRAHARGTGPSRKTGQRADTLKGDTTPGYCMAPSPSVAQGLTRPATCSESAASAAREDTDAVVPGRDDHPTLSARVGE
jgi:hypothetical protein